MRQAGVIAAPGLIALRDGPAGMIERWPRITPTRAGWPTGLAGLPGVTNLDPTRVRTNFVFFELVQPELRLPFLDALARAGTEMIPYPGGDRIRAVTHYGIDSADIDRAIVATRRALAAVGLAPAVAVAGGIPSPVGLQLQPASVASAPIPATPAEQRLERLLGDRFAAIVERYPVFGTYLGLHEHDHRLGDGSRAAIVAEIDGARAFLTELEAIDARELSPYWAIERELALLATRRQLFDDDVHRVWERRVSATDEIGDGIFLTLRARHAAAAPSGWRAIASRLEAAAGPHRAAEDASRPAATDTAVERDGARGGRLAADALRRSRRRRAAGAGRQPHAEVRRLGARVGGRVGGARELLGLAARAARPALTTISRWVPPTYDELDRPARLRRPVDRRHPRDR